MLRKSTGHSHKNTLAAHEHPIDQTRRLAQVCPCTVEVALVLRSEPDGIEAETVRSKERRKAEHDAFDTKQTQILSILEASVGQNRPGQMNVVTVLFSHVRTATSTAGPQQTQQTPRATLVLDF